MVIRQVKANYWKHVYSQITTYGRGAPLSLQFDIDLNCNGVNYILKVQPERNQRVVALQALGGYLNDNGAGGKEYQLIEDNAVLSALLEMILYQGAKKHGA
ncbi:MAG: hypothetical protein LIO58_03850 [Oscillospiraceae bacterium]|nr:hypothetical protein [Oscillospiraceae bacterium]